MTWRIEVLIFAALIAFAYAHLVSEGLDRGTEILKVSQGLKP